MIYARHRPILVVILSASLWGLFWMPIRAFEDMGLSAGWATLAQFVTPALILAPLALWRAAGGRATGEPSGSAPMFAAKRLTSGFQAVLTM